MNSLSIDRLKNRILSLRSRNILLTTHKNADPDALASLFVLYGYLSMNKNYVSMVFPEGLNEVAKNIMGILLEKYYLRVIELDEFIHGLYSVFDSAIIVDTSSSVQLGNILRYLLQLDKVIVIDHHRSGDLRTIFPEVFVDPSYRSTSEIIAELLHDVAVLDKDYYTLLLAGIIYDTRRFIHVSHKTFNMVSKLLDLGADYNYALKILRKEMDLPERIARLKAAQRMHLYRCGEYLLAITHVGAYESSVANALLELGADVAVVYSGKKKYIRVTMRARNDFYRNTGISLARDIAPLIAEVVKGVGGGHDTASSIEGEYIPRKFDEKIRVLICRLIRDRTRYDR